MYRLADMVMHISPMDQVAEKEDFPFVKYYKLLRMPIRAFRILNKNTPASMQDRNFLRTANIGFIGNGMTGLDEFVHAPRYDFNDEITARGVAYWTEIVRAELP